MLTITMADRKRFLRTGANVIIVGLKEKTGIVWTNQNVEVIPLLGEDGRQKKYRGRNEWSTRGRFSLTVGGEPNGSYINPIIATNSLGRRKISKEKTA